MDDYKKHGSPEWGRKSRKAYSPKATMRAEAKKIAHQETAPMPTPEETAFNTEVEKLNRESAENLDNYTPYEEECELGAEPEGAGKAGLFCPFGDCCKWD